MTCEDKEQEGDNEYDSSENFRMWAGISFAFMLIVIGIPLWWKTTEVHRAPLPYDEINSLDPNSLKISMYIKVYSVDSKGDTIIEELMDSFSSVTLYSLKFRFLNLDPKDATYKAIESSNKYHSSSLSEIVLFQVPQLENNDTILVSNRRAIYFTPSANPQTIEYVISNWFLCETLLKNKIKSIVSPEKLEEHEKESLHLLRASLNYDVIFTIVNPDPERVNLHWDVDSAVRSYVAPLLDQLSAVSEHAVKSQWLYYTDLGQVPKRYESGHFVLGVEQLPHIITPLEKKLGSGISKHPSVHLILYTTPCHFSPLTFLSGSGEKVSGMISPQWGAIQILNPTPANCVNGTELKPDSPRVMAQFVSLFHSLLGARNKADIPGLSVMSPSGPLLRDWELDNIYRLRTVEHVTSASQSLQSLAKLLGEISNIVINEDVAGSIKMAVDSVQAAIDKLHSSQMIEALRISKTAYREAETAFSDPSLLALLYFPDDQKYAVYIPLFLPIMIPVLMSLRKIYHWVFTKKAKVKEA